MESTIENDKAKKLSDDMTSSLSRLKSGLGLLMNSFILQVNEDGETEAQTNRPRG